MQKLIGKAVGLLGAVLWLVIFGAGIAHAVSTLYGAGNVGRDAPSTLYRHLPGGRGAVG